MSARDTLKAALDEMRVEHAQLGDAIAVLAKLVDGDEKNGGGTAVKRGRKATAAKAASVETPGGIGKGGGWPRTKECEDCGAKYSATGSRSQCPKCNPRVVTAKEASDRPRAFNEG
jgi:DNA-directed RNA polymerase subunit RPC12/RpoP